MAWLSVLFPIHDHKMKVNPQECSGLAMRRSYTFYVKKKCKKLIAEKVSGVAEGGQ